MKVAVLFDRFGPYHVARLKAAEKYMELLPIEIFGETSEYQWEKVKNIDLKNRVVLFEEKQNNQTSSKEIFKAVTNQLSKVQPNVVAINGWYDRAALSALLWCIKNKIPAILMSESSEEDGPRVWWKEQLKRKIVYCYSAGLVGGQRHVHYLKKLGMAEENIFIGYDVVDNEYFQLESAKAKRVNNFSSSQCNLEQGHLLVVSRFIEKKNLLFVLRVYSEYRKSMGEKAWHLVILGDGPLKQKLLKETEELSLREFVHFEGFKQYGDLPRYFASAKAFLHASTSEQWGLVVNEAMASGLPVIISERCGCVPELVHDGVNGFSFDPTNERHLTSILVSLTRDTQNLVSMGRESLRIVSKFNTDAFGRGLFDSVNAAIKNKKIGKVSLKTKIILRSLIRR